MRFLYNAYFYLPNFARIGIIGKIVNRGLEIILKRIFDVFIPFYLKHTADKAGFGLNTEPRDETYIVSITSFPARINDIWITIETILRQSFKPDKIILWLGQDQFPLKELPQSLTNLLKRGLTIEFVEDLRSHTKYYYSFQGYSNSNVITLDDDIYYPKNTIKNLVGLHKTNPKAICSNRVHKMTFNRNEINPYRKWIHIYKGKLKTSNMFLLTGVGGVLYPPGAFKPEVLDKETFKKLCYFADDIWLTIHAIRNNTAIYTNSIFNKDLITVSKTQSIRLLTNNSHGGGNDEQLRNICKYHNINLLELKDSNS